MQARFDTQAVVASEVARLEEPYRSIVYQRFFEGRTLAEIAEHRGAPASTVRNQSQRALETLRHRLEARLGRREMRSTLLVLFVGHSLAPQVPGPIQASGGGNASGSGTKPMLGKLAMAAVCVVAGLWALALLTRPNVTPSDTVTTLTEVLERQEVPRKASLASHPVDTIRESPGTQDSVPSEKSSQAEVMSEAAVQVFDQEGVPVAGAQVALLTREQPQPIVLEVTNDQGIAEVPRDSLVREALVVMGPEHAEYREPLNVRRLTNDMYEVSLSLPQEATIVIRNNSGRPIAGAKVEWVPCLPFPGCDSASGGTLLSDEQGEVRFQRRMYRNRVTIRALGYADVVLNVRESLVEATLRPGFAAEGRLVDSDGAPVSDCAVRISVARPGELVRHATTDGWGEFAIGNVEPEAELTLEFLPIDRPTIRVEGKPPREGIWEFQLPEGIAISGVVRGPDGHAVRGGFVFFVRPSSELAPSPSKLRTPGTAAISGRDRLVPVHRAPIGERGFYELGPVSYDELNSGFLFVHHRELCNQLRPLGELTHGRSQDFWLERGADLRGRALDPDGGVASGVTLFLGELWQCSDAGGIRCFENVVGRARTDEEGHFSFSGVPATGERMVLGDGLAAERTSLVLKAFSPSRLVDVEGSPGPLAFDSQSFSVDPRVRNDLALIVVSDTHVEEYDFALVNARGEQIDGWLRTLRVGCNGETRWGHLGVADGLARLYLEGDPVEDPPCRLIVSDKRFAWRDVAVEARQEVRLREQAQQGTRLLLRQAPELQSRQFHLYAGVPFWSEAPTAGVWIGSTDSSGSLQVHNLDATSCLLFAEPVVGGGTPEPYLAYKTGDASSRCLGRVRFFEGAEHRLDVSCCDEYSEVDRRCAACDHSDRLGSGRR